MPAHKKGPIPNKKNEAKVVDRSFVNDESVLGHSFLAYVCDVQQIRR